MLLAVLERRAETSFADLDVFVQVTAGVRLTEPGADLAVAAALLSQPATTGPRRPMSSSSARSGSAARSGRAARSSAGSPRRRGSASAGCSAPRAAPSQVAGRLAGRARPRRAAGAGACRVTSASSSWPPGGASGSAARPPSSISRSAVCRWCCGRSGRSPPIPTSRRSCWCCRPRTPTQPAGVPSSPTSPARRLTIVAGGARAGRLGSRPGSRRCRRDCAVVLVHDGARPFVDREVIDAVIGYARGGRGRGRRGAAERHAQGGDRGGSHADRADRPARPALAGADAAGLSPRGAGAGARPRRRAAATAPPTTPRWSRPAAVRVRLVPDSPRNLKVTTPEDLALAELLAGASPVILPFRTDAEIAAAIPRSARASRARRAARLSHRDGLRARLGSHGRRRSPRSRGSRGDREGKPFLLLISGRAMAEEWGLVFIAVGRGAVGGVLARAADAGAARAARAACRTSCGAGRAGIAVRHTSHAGIARLVAATGRAAHLDLGQPPRRARRRPAPTGSGRAVRPRGVDSGELLVLDGGVLGNVPPSTLVDCTDPMPRLVREGAIPRAELRRAAGRLAP